MSGSLKWCEISIQAERHRFETLSAVLKENGLDNSVEFIETTLDEFPAVCAQAMQKFDQIRIGSQLGGKALEVVEQRPTILQTVRMCDAIEKDSTQGQAVWWPRCFLIDGISRTLAEGKKPIDVGGGVLISGSQPRARALVAALTSIGFRRFVICDQADDLAVQLVAELSKIYFNVQIEAVAHSMVTQLPAIYSIAANNLSESEAPELLNELVYFNFLRIGGVWLDLVLTPENKALADEAQSIGADVRSGLRVAAGADVRWAENCLGIKLDYELLFQRLLTVPT